MRRKTPIREYPPDTHRLGRSARLDHVVTWVQRWVADDTEAPVDRHASRSLTVPPVRSKAPV